jgi:prevent-host-death family protein
MVQAPDPSDTHPSDTDPSDAALDRVGIRELRNTVAAVVRRAGAGERIVVSVDGAPVAQLGPLSGAGDVTLDDLVAAGLARPAPRSDRPPTPHPVDPHVDARARPILDEHRGA